MLEGGLIDAVVEVLFECAGDLARATGAPMLRLASGVFVLLRREAFSLTFFLVALVTAQRMVSSALVAAGLAVVAATLVSYRGEIEDSIATYSPSKF